MRFEAGTRLLAYPGAISALGEFGAQRLLLVTDPFFYNNGTAARVAAASGAAHTEIFHRIRPDPTVTLAAEATERMRSFGPDLVAALGGGSALDCAKAMVYFSGLDVPLAAIPTTSGSGSEVTDFAILTHQGTKYPLIHPRLRPHTAILDSELLTTLPKALIAETGFDAIAHAVESYVAKNAGAVTDCLALDAFRTVTAHLPASYAGDTSRRQRIHIAATMAAMAFNQAGLGLCHGLAHALGARFHVPHGRLNAVLLPPVIGCNGHAAGEKYARLAQAMGFVGSTPTLGVRNLKNGLIRLRRQLSLPGTLQEAGIDPAQLRSQMEAIVSDALADPCCATNPLGPEAFMVRQVLEEAMGRG